MRTAALEYARRRQIQYLNQLIELIRIPSVSTLPKHASDVLRAAGWLAGYLRQAGMEQVQILPTGGYPVVYSEWLGAGPSRPTVLIYGHYDVQPVDPLEEWQSPPFEPAVRGENLYGRGASDDKGQLFALLAAADAYLKTAGRLPINLKFMIEGEEELTSPHIAAIVEQHRERLAADAVLIADDNMLDESTPVILYGLRGLVYLEIEVCGPAADLHSGTFGGVVDNPLNVLAHLVAGLQDPVSRRILVPGFYDRVQPPNEAERKLLAKSKNTEQLALRYTGVPALGGEPGYSVAERVSLRPTMDLHGVSGGFAGHGRKTMIPHSGIVKLSMRLVPNQDPVEIAEMVEKHLRAAAPPTVHVEVRRLGLNRPILIDYDTAAVRAAAWALEAAFGVAPIYQRSGGSSPIVGELQEKLNAPVVMTGFGLPDDNVHAPNEKLYLGNFYRGIEMAVHFYDEFCLETG